MFFNSQNLKRMVFTHHIGFGVQMVCTHHIEFGVQMVYTHHVFKAFKLSCKHGVDPVLSIMSMQPALLTF